MNIATLRVNGDEYAVAQLPAAFRIAPDQSWKKGQPRRRGGHFTASGSSFLIADESTQAAMVLSIRKFLEQCSSCRDLFNTRSLSAELAIGVTVGDDEQFVAVVEFAPSDLQTLADLGIGLSVAAYPTSTEANDAEASKQ